MGDLKGGDVSAGRGVTRRRMKEDWDDRAREDVYRYVDHRANTDEELHTLGVQDTELLLADVGRVPIRGVPPAGPRRRRDWLRPWAAACAHGQPVPRGLGAPTCGRR